MSPGPGAGGDSRGGPPPRILHVAAEAAPFVRTGGLGDVLGALPAAQAALGADVRVLVPGYPAVVGAITAASVVAAFPAPRQGGFCRLLATPPQVPAPSSADPAQAGRAPGRFSWYVLDCPWRYERSGGPYEEAGGSPWPDNAMRFGLLGWIAAQLAAGGLDAEWRPDLLHVHDWHAALAPWWLRSRPGPSVPSALSIHNIGYQGLFPPSRLADLGLPASDWHPGALEYHGQLSFLKAGVVAATGVATVSPTHAQEIVTPAIGHGMDGVLRHRGDLPLGILNGIDTAHWNPATDPALAHRFDPGRIDDELFAARARNRAALADELGLPAQLDQASPQRPMLAGVVSRFASQKGIDLLVAAAPALFASGCDLIVLGSGDRELELELSLLSARHPGRMVTRIGFDDALARRIYGSCDLMLVPSRYEPCGLTQMYAMRYGALPLVRRTGGLADTVDASNGFVFEAAEPDALAGAVREARQLFDHFDGWRARMVAALQRDHSWGRAAAAYLDWYRRLSPQRLHG